MKRLTFEDIRPWFQGTLGVREEAQALQPIRLPEKDLPFHHESLVSPMAALATSGVRIVLATDSNCIAIDVDQETNGRYPAPATYDLVLDDGRIIRAPATSDEGPARVEFLGLGRARKRLEIWLPSGLAVKIRGIGVDDDASVEAVPDTRPHWITYGSSITHCAWVPGPTETWPSIVARAIDWRLTSLGFNGQCHLDPLVARAIAETPADRITLKLGINVHNWQSMRERTFAPFVHGFLATIRERQPAVPITVISPIFSPEREDTGITHIPARLGLDPFHGDLSVRDMRSALEQIVSARSDRGDENLTYLDGRQLLGADDAALLSDGLHPSTEGYALMARQFLEHEGRHW